MPRKQAFKDAFKTLFKSKDAIERRAELRRLELHALLEDIHQRLQEWKDAQIGRGYRAFREELHRIEEKLTAIEEKEETSYIRLGRLIQDAQKHLARLQKKQDEAAGLFRQAEEALAELNAEIDNLEDLDEQIHGQFVALRDKAAARLEEARRSESRDDWKKAGQAIEALVLQARQARPVTLTVEGENLRLDGRSIPGIWELPEEERQEKLEAIGKQIARGREIWNLLGTDDEPKATRKDVAAVAWHLRARSERKAGHWYKGTITLDDPDQKLYHWLRSCSMRYGRWSSHLKKDQTGVRRNIGIDFYEGEDDVDYLLPFGTRTILAQEFSRDGKQMLMMKMETQGTKLPFTGGRTFTPKDLGRSIAHLNNFRHGRQETGMSTHAEKYVDIPEPVREAYAELAALTEQEPELRGLAYRGVEYDSDGEIKDFEVNQMFSNLKAMLEKLEQPDDSGEDSAQEVPEEIQKIVRAMFKFYGMCEIAWGTDFEDDVAQRIGDEIILHTGDLS